MLRKQFVDSNILIIVKVFLLFYDKLRCNRGTCMRYFVIVNPTAGRGAGEKSVPEIEKRFTAYKLDYTLVRTECPWHADDLAARMGLPLTLGEGFKVLKENHRRKIDIGRATVRVGDELSERYFGNGIGIGFDAMVGFEGEKVRWAVGRG